MTGEQPQQGRVYCDHDGKWHGYTYGRRVGHFGHVTRDGVGTCVGPFDTRGDAVAAVNAASAKTRVGADLQVRLDTEEN